jgi:pilus biogenesis lipoprotein CpaD
MTPRMPPQRWARLSPLLLAGMLLAACEPSAKMMGTLRGPMPQTPPPIVVRDQHRSLAMDLPPNGALSPSERRRIAVFLHGSAEGRPDAVHLTIAGNPSPPVIDEVVREAFEMGYDENRISVAPPRMMGNGRRMSLELTTAAYVPVLPNCPNTAHLNLIDGNNLVSSDLGCSVISDLELQVANPRDLVQGEGGGEADSAMTTAAITRLQSDKVKKYIGSSSTTSIGGGS